MFGHDSEPSLVYAYGARRPTEGLDQVLDQMRAAHRYRNQLVEIERARRAAVDAALLALSPDLVAVDAEITAHQAALDLARQEIQDASRDARTRRKPDAAGAAAVKALREALKTLRARRKELRGALFTSTAWTERQSEIDARDLAARKAARAESGLYWGTYLHVEQSLSGCRRGAPPQFLAWDRTGHLAVQTQGGLDPADLADDTRLRVDLPPPSAYERGEGRKGRRADVRFRVGSAEDGSPVWAVVPCVLHRPIPADARIKWAHLLVEHLGEPAERWTVQIVLSRASGWAKPDRAREGTVGVDVGWRLLADHSLRVAVAVGDDGALDTAVLPASWLADVAKCDDLRSIRDRAHGLARDALAAWILGRDDAPEGLVGAPVPAWLAEACFRSYVDVRGRARRVDLRQWRSPARLLEVWYRWRREGDATGPAWSLLDAWARQERHLWSWDQHLWRQLQDQRREVYRLFAARLRRRYRTAVLLDWDLRAAARLPRVEDGAPEGAMREHQRDACVSSLRELLQQQMDVERIEDRAVSRRCSVCGCVAEEGSAELVMECACGHVEDQDERAARNLLASGRMIAEARAPLAADAEQDVMAARCQGNRDDGECR